MAKVDIVRAWKDSVYRASLGDSVAATLPPNPAGLVELNDDELKSASGLAGIALTTAQTCTELSFRGFRRCCPK
jgi:mersacidin/lichenicidin family type 2 lantibiotic